MLQIRNLTKVFPDGTVALKDVSFDVQDGEFLAVIGLSGSGKSTLLRCINRLIDPTSGQVIWNGQDVTAASGAELRLIRRQIGMVFQHFNLVKRSSVTTNVLSGRLGYVSPVRSLFGRWSAEDRRRAMAAMTRVGIEEKADNRADQLSGGQQQRVGIARALAVKPRLMLLDEPTSALDPELVEEVLQVIRSLADDGMTMVMVTHEMSFAAQISDVVVFMEAGQIIETGAPQGLFNAPKTERLQQFLKPWFNRSLQVTS